ncbi:MAG: C-terminal binding protein [Eggerthellaceae bacterium]|nr:C-terminal binding protein [Eggerthellaceae bacterium]
MRKIVMTDSDFGSCEFEEKMVTAAGISFSGYDSKEGRTPEELIEHLHGADGAITSYGKYTSQVFEACPNLKVVCKTGTGVDNIDVEAATKNGTAVCNVVGYGTEVVSDHAIALALSIIRRIPELDSDLRRGIWDYQRRRPLGQVRGRTFGVVGMGNIGRAVAEKAKGLGFHVIAWDRRGQPGRFTPEGIPFVTFDELLRTSDVVSFHTALTQDTTHMLDAQNIKSMKHDAIVINTSRGAVIDVDAVASALADGLLWGAGIDVFPTEPLPESALIRKAPNAVLTPHAAYWSEESGVELQTRCTQNAIDVVLGKEPEDCVNPEALPAAFAK